jgi:hypothetical protein
MEQSLACAIDFCVNIGENSRFSSNLIKATDLHTRTQTHGRGGETIILPAFFYISYLTKLSEYKQRR